MKSFTLWKQAVLIRTGGHTMRFFKLFKYSQKNLLDEAHSESIAMLELVKDMFGIITETLAGESSTEKLEKISNVDKKVNRLHRDTRKKVYEHLAISGTGDLFSSLVILSVVDDVERIGDYNKNIADVALLIPNKLNLRKYEKTFYEIQKDTVEFFDMTLKALREDNLKLASTILTKYTALSIKCDSIIEDIIKGDKKDTIRKDFVALVLLLRYFKRVNAHLTNVATTIINPFHRIGYRPKKKHLKKAIPAKKK